MVKEENVLLAQIAALESNLKRVNMLMGNEEVQYRTPLAGKFLRLTNPPRGRLERLKVNVEENRLTEGKAWEEYRSVKQDIQRVFNQCLDYIGGIAIRKWKLEENICEMAELLVNQYVNLGASWTSVAIVGEERLFDTVAQTTQIIRLRFPEWDIWSLPFTAYEFGRWMAGEEDLEGLSTFFNEEEGRMRQLITAEDAALIGAGDTTEDEIKNLPPVIKTQREAYHAGRRNAAESDRLVAEQREDAREQMRRLIEGDATDEEIKNMSAEIKRLREGHQAATKNAEEIDRFVPQVCMFMKDLFADAFATYFLGPAYPYARVCLRLDPSEALEDRPHEPSMARRMGLMLRILNEMNNLAKAEPLDDGPYGPECRRLTMLWETTVKALKPDYSAKFDFGQPFDRWSKQIYDVLRSTYRDDGFTGENWKDAESLGQQFLEEKDISPDASPSLPIILNAAWYCRVRNSDRVDKTVKEALKVLKGRSETATSTQAGAGPKPGAQTPSGRPH